LSFFSARRKGRGFSMVLPSDSVAKCSSPRAAPSAPRRPHGGRVARRWQRRGPGARSRRRHKRHRLRF
jgi:hypothetical protein